MIDITTTHSSIASINEPFKFSEDGELKIFFSPADYMMGMFIISIEAKDTVDKTGITEVNVFLIGNDNKVFFIFNNSPEEIGNKRDTVRK